MKVVIRPKGTIELFEKGIAKVFTEDGEGRKEEVGSYKQSLLPGANKTLRVFWDESKREYDISISDEELQAAVDEFKLVDAKTQKLIVKADRKNEMDPFFISLELEIVIPNSGKVLDSENAVDNFWIKAAYGDEKKFEVQGKESNPLYERVQEFKVTTAGYKERKNKEQINEGKRASKLFSGISDDFEMMLSVAKGFGIEFDKNNTPNISDLEDILYSKFTIEKDYKTKDGRRNIELFIDLASSKKSKIRLIAIISDAIAFDILDKDGRMYLYEDEELGVNVHAIYDYITEDKNAEIQANIIRDVAKITGKVKSDKKVNLLENEKSETKEEAKEEKKASKPKAKSKAKAKDEKKSEKSDDGKDDDKGNGGEIEFTDF